MKIQSAFRLFTALLFAVALVTACQNETKEHPPVSDSVVENQEASEDVPAPAPAGVRFMLDDVEVKSDSFSGVWNRATNELELSGSFTHPATGQSWTLQLRFTKLNTLSKPFVSISEAANYPDAIVYYIQLQQKGAPAYNNKSATDFFGTAHLEKIDTAAATCSGDFNVQLSNAQKQTLFLREGTFNAIPLTVKQ